MKGKREFTESEIDRLRELIRKRVHATREQQKRIRDAMRRIGFYGQADWGIQDCQLEDLDGLIRSGQITVTGATAPRPAGGVPNPADGNRRRARLPKRMKKRKDWTVLISTSGVSTTCVATASPALSP